MYEQTYIHMYVRANSTLVGGPQGIVNCTLCPTSIPSLADTRSSAGMVRTSFKYLFDTFNTSNFFEGNSLYTIRLCNSLDHWPTKVDGTTISVARVTYRSRIAFVDLCFIVFRPPGLVVSPKREDGSPVLMSVRGLLTMRVITSIVLPVCVQCYWLSGVQKMVKVCNVKNNRRHTHSQPKITTHHTIQSTVYYNNTVRNNNMALRSNI
jgi:hypothetical protein